MDEAVLDLDWRTSVAGDPGHSDLSPRGQLLVLTGVLSVVVGMAWVLSPDGGRTDLAALPTAESVEVSDLPEFDATHFAVHAGSRLYFLNLDTGIWTTSILPSEARLLHPLEAGVVLALGAGDVAYAGVGGGELAYVASPSDGDILGVGANLVWLRDPESDVVTGHSIDTTTEPRVVQLPTGTDAVGVLTSGELVIQDRERVVLYDAATAQRQQLATGTVTAVLEDLILVHACGEALDCGLDQIKAGTGGQRQRINDHVGWFEPTGDSRWFRFWPLSATEGVSAIYQLEDGTLTPTDYSGSPASVPLGPWLVADPNTGSMVSFDGNEIRFADNTGAVVTTIPEPFPISEFELPTVLLVG